LKTIILASANPVKIQATLNGFKSMFPGDEFTVESVDIPSGVNHQPMSDDETLLGAKNRAEKAASLSPQADFWVGIEGGIEKRGGQMGAFAWVVVRGNEQTGMAKTGTFFLPHQINQLIEEGMELGDADDFIFQRTNSKQKNGAIGLLTGDIIDRVRLYEPAVVMALIPFKNPDIYMA
jgi:inosine/xanthosine triphosphatase